MKEQWEREKKRLLGEKAILQDTAHKLNLQVRSAQDEAKRAAESGKAAQKARVSVQAVSLILSVFRCVALSDWRSVRKQELDMAKQSITTLESELRAERSKLRSLLTEQDRCERERENVLAELRRTESVSNIPSVRYQNYPAYCGGSQDMDDVKASLYRVKQDNHQLETELRGM